MLCSRLARAVHAGRRALGSQRPPLESTQQETARAARDVAARAEGKGGPTRRATQRSAKREPEPEPEPEPSWIADAILDDLLDLAPGPGPRPWEPEWRPPTFRPEPPTSRARPAGAARSLAPTAQKKAQPVYDPGKAPQARSRAEAADAPSSSGSSAGGGNTAHSSGAGAAPSPRVRTVEPRAHAGGRAAQNPPATNQQAAAGGQRRTPAPRPAAKAEGRPPRARLFPDVPGPQAQTPSDAAAAQSTPESQAAASASAAAGPTPDASAAPAPPAEVNTKPEGQAWPIHVLWDLDNKYPIVLNHEQVVANIRRALRPYGRVVEMRAYCNYNTLNYVPGLWQEAENLGLPHPLEEDVPDELRCPLCGQKFKEEGKLQHHFKQLHARERNKVFKSGRTKTIRKYKASDKNARYLDAAKQVLRKPRGYDLEGILTAAGVKVVPVQMGPQRADVALERDAMALLREVQVAQLGVPPVLAIISDDHGFEPLLKLFGSRGWRTIIIGNTYFKNAHVTEIWQQVVDVSR